MAGKIPPICQWALARSKRGLASMSRVAGLGSIVDSGTRSALHAIGATPGVAGGGAVTSVGAGAGVAKGSAPGMGARGSSTTMASITLIPSESAAGWGSSVCSLPQWGANGSSTSAYGFPVGVP